MELNGSCHCGAVKFSILSNTPQPFVRCYCSICRKVDGGGGYTINIMGKKDTLKINGQEHLKTYTVQMPCHETGELKPSPVHRVFCEDCGSHLWHEGLSEGFVYPFAGAIDTPDLPVPPHRVHMMLGRKAPWVVPEVKSGDQTFDSYPDMTVPVEKWFEEWHKDNGCYVEKGK